MGGGVCMIGYIGELERVKELVAEIPALSAKTIAEGSNRWVDSEVTPLFPKRMIRFSIYPLPATAH